ncbi:phospholipase-like protein [Tanacetum coccineum]
MQTHLRINIGNYSGKEKLYAKFSKCDFWIHIVQFLGHLIDSQGLHVDPAKIEAVKNWTSPILLPKLQLDDKPNFVEEPVEVMDREIKQLKRSRIPIVKVRWSSKRGPEFTWEREDEIRAKYPHLFSIITSTSNQISGRDFQFLIKSSWRHCKFPWCNDISVDGHFWDALIGLDDKRLGWLLDDVFIPINEPKRHWSLAQFHIQYGNVTFYDSQNIEGVEYRLWYLKMRSCLKTKLPVLLHRTGVFASKGIDPNNYSIKFSQEQNVLQDVKIMYEMADLHGHLEVHVAHFPQYLVTDYYLKNLCVDETDDEVTKQLLSHQKIYKEAKCFPSDLKGKSLLDDFEKVEGEGEGLGSSSSKFRLV